MSGEIKAVSGGPGEWTLALPPEHAPRLLVHVTSPWQRHKNNRTSGWWFEYGGPLGWARSIPVQTDRYSCRVICPAAIREDLRIDLRTHRARAGVRSTRCTPLLRQTKQNSLTLASIPCITVSVWIVFAVCYDYWWQFRHFVSCRRLPVIMATMVRLMSETEEIVNETYNRINEAEETRPLELKSVLKIQAWFRASRVRSYLKHLDRCATNIQRRWRGYLGRGYYRQLLKDKVFVMKLNYYNALATKVQKVWRGYYTRRYVANYYSRKRYLQGLMIKNEIVRNQLQEFADQQEDDQLRAQHQEALAREEEEARRKHFLLSTHVQPGIYNSPFLPAPSEMEMRLRTVKPLGREAEKKGKIFDPSWRRYDVPRHEPLPPLQPKPQGPFREAEKVQKQRYKPFEPSLRVNTDFYSLDKARQSMKEQEWATRINDEIFLPCKRKSYPYAPLLHTTSKYGHLSYGHVHFREETIEKFIDPNNFQSVIPPIPILEKLNNTYSQGQVWSGVANFCNRT